MILLEQGHAQIKNNVCVFLCFSCYLSGNFRMRVYSYNLVFCTCFHNSVTHSIINPLLCYYRTIFTQIYGTMWQVFPMSCVYLQYTHGEWCGKTTKTTRFLFLTLLSHDIGLQCIGVITWIPEGLKPCVWSWFKSHFTFQSLENWLLRKIYLLQ